MNKSVLTSAVIEHLRHCRNEVAQIDTYIQNNVLNEAQLKIARIRREKAMMTLISAKFILDCLDQWNQKDKEDRFIRLKELLAETSGDLKQRFIEYKQKQKSQ